MKAKTLGIVAGLALLAGCTAEEPQNTRITPERIAATDLETLWSTNDVHFVHNPGHRAVMDYRTCSGEYVSLDVFCIYQTPPLVLEVCVSKSPFYQTNPDDVAPKYCLYAADNEVFNQAEIEAEKILDFFHFPEELRHTCN